MKAIVYDAHTDIFPTDEEVKQVCKMGQGAECCVWLTVDARGFVCRAMNKPGILMDRFRDGKTGAKRDGCDIIRNWSPLGLEGEVEIQPEQSGSGDAER